MTERRIVGHHPVGIQTDDKESWEKHRPAWKAEWTASVSTTFLAPEEASPASQIATLCTDHGGRRLCAPENQVDYQLRSNQAANLTPGDNRLCSFVELIVISYHLHHNPKTH